MHVVHKWSKWEDTIGTVTYKRTGREFDEVMQMRTCSKCNKRVLRAVG